MSEQAGGRVTIRDVARLAGVSPATVSQVLNRARPVAASTRERTLDVIAQLDYRPNVFGRGLRTRRSHLVGVVLPDLSNPFYPVLVRGVQDRLGPEGYHTVIGNTDGDSGREGELLTELMDCGVDGVVHVSFSMKPTEFPAVVKRGFPLVVIGAASGFDHVHTNDFRASFEMTTYLLDLLHVELGRARNASPIIVVGATDERLEFARHRADAVVDARVDDVVGSVREATGGGAAGVAVCVGMPSSVTTGLALARPGGVVNVFAGMPGGEGTPVDFGRIHYEEVKLIGTFGSRPADFRLAASLIGDGLVDLAPYVTSKVLLENAIEAFEQAGDNHGVKTVIVMNPRV